MPAVTVEGLSKEYATGGALPSFRRIFSKGGGPVARGDRFWALQDVSFEVRRGEAVGVIGRNGAGKSTLLKILARIVEPTRGRAVLRGRVGSLLEVGTGFHPELTGRDNVFLNGVILGMSRAQLRRKFDQIVDFAGVERFIDTPVKRYSSGMYVRLAFAVAAHVEPEILIVDEVLAVGDAEFQKKCLGKMGEVTNEGRTVLFVSHQMAAVQNLCREAIWIEKGRVVANGDAEGVIGRYIGDAMSRAEAPLSERRDRRGNGAVRFVSASLGDGAGGGAAFRCGCEAVFRFRYEAPGGRPLRNVLLSLGVDDRLGQRILWLSNEMTGELFGELPGEPGTLTVRIPRLPLAPGSYGYTLCCTVNGDVADWIQGAGRFDVAPGDFYGTGHLPPGGQGSFLADVRFAAGP